MTFIVPDEFMISTGAKATKELGRCADSWTDSDVAILRAELPTQFHAVPLDALRRRWINIRKRGTEGFRLNGKGPSKGWKAARLKTPDWYADYLKTDHWREFRVVVLDFWEWRCCLCNREDGLDVHHRTYEHRGCEKLNDCVVLCRPCHDLYEDGKEQGGLFA
jgi:hypothetical protein